MIYYSLCHTIKQCYNNIISTFIYSYVSVLSHNLTAYFRIEHCTDIFTGFRPDGEFGATQERYMLNVVDCVVWSYGFVAASCLLLLLDSSVEAPASNFRGFRSPCGVYLLHSAEAKMRLLVTNSVLTYGLHTLSHFLIASSAYTVNSHNELSWLRSL